ncbi:hypothetical protein HIM_03516 [Hirsutella minnesotensis 3608]|uniref:BAR domain-containing protein n=1 Tax=Hirsutella minnesotensis 3608 TaxID=1043627 RepID=A0A0F7ZQG2_9HYPO|nr:hypothetical protein HIM_03516 [Hirsutella minnesotensis 3608]
MTFTKKIDRARQWAGEKMGAEARTTQSDEFQVLQAEMALRQSGTENLQKSAGLYMKWASRRCDALEDKSRSTPVAIFGGAMTAHASELESASEYRNCLAQIGCANERIAQYHSNYTEDVTAGWLQHLERSVTMMKEYQAARKKLESRRLAYDASLAKFQKSKRDDFRVEDEMRVCKTKFDDSTEEVLRRMQDIKDAEVDDVAALSSLLDAQLTFHERAAEELRRTRESLEDVTISAQAPQEDLSVSRPRSRPATLESVPSRRTKSSQVMPPPPPPLSTRPSMSRTSTFGLRSASSASPATRTPVLSRTATDMSIRTNRPNEAYSDDELSPSESESPGWGNRSVSSTTSHDSVARVNPVQAVKKAPPPPPPPVNRAKKPPPPPVPTRRANLGY